jgi:hypothetical protein
VSSENSDDDDDDNDKRTTTVDEPAQPLPGLNAGVDQLEATDEDDESDKHDEDDDEADGDASDEDGDNKNRAGAIAKSLCYSQFADNNESFSLLPAVLFFSKDTLVDVSASFFNFKLQVPDLVPRTTLA